MNDKVTSGIRIERPIYEHEQFRKHFNYTKQKHKTRNCFTCDVKSSKKLFLKTLPFIENLQRYKWQTDLIGDVIAGITVAIMHIPQAIAYAMLASLPPVVGIYSGIFPVLIYVLLGTSRHNSIGAFPVTCLMTAKVVIQYSHPSFFAPVAANGSAISYQVNVSDQNFYSPTQIAAILSFTVGLIQLGMCVLRLGLASALLSEPLISGFTTGAAVQVLFSQISDLLGLMIPKHDGLFVVVKTVSSVVEKISETNYAALTVSCVTIAVIVLNNEVLKPILSKRIAFPIPVELIALIAGTLVSKYCSLQEHYHIKVVGDIPSGLPEPAAPPFSLIGSIMIDSFTIAIVAYSVTLSLALVFAEKSNYEIDANQELLAQGAGNIFASFFSCLPVAACMTRCVVQHSTGGKTQIASLVSAGLFVVVVLWFGSFFGPLPKSVLAAIVVMALQEMLVQVIAVYKYWKLSKLDAFVWMGTFLTTVIVSMEVGLLLGVILSIATIFGLSLKPYACLLGLVPGTNIYVDIDKYGNAIDFPEIKVFHYCGGLNFATKNIFKNKLLSSLNINPQKELIYRQKLIKYNEVDEIDSKDNITKSEKAAIFQEKINKHIKCIILDFSSLSHIDPSGVTALQTLTDSFSKIDISIYIAACQEPAYEKISKCGLTESQNAIRLFPTIHDGVKFGAEALEIKIPDAMKSFF